MTDQSKVFQLMALNKAATLFASVTDPAGLAALVVDVMVEMAEARAGALYLPDEEGAAPGELRRAGAKSLGGQGFPEALRSGDALAGRLGRADARPMPVVDAGDGGEGLGVPIRGPGGLAGLCLLSGHLKPGGWSQSDIEVLETLAAHAAVSLENARALAALRRQFEALRRAQAELLRAEETYRAIVEGLPAVMYVARPDEERSTLYVSPQIEALVGVTAAEWMADPGLWARRLHPDDRERALEEFARAAASGAPFASEYRLLATDGRVVWVRDTALLAPDREGQGKVMRGFITDITARKAAEDEVQHQRESASQREKLASMGELLAGVAHELNNPISVVLGQAALLASTPEAKRADRVRKISVAADRCARIVKNFLALARQHPPERSRVALNRIARESVELLAYGLRVDNVEVALALDEGLPPVLGDPHQLQQVLINLITNAHHALRKVPGPRRITVATRCGGAAGPVVLEVADTGPGIPREIQQKIFEPFFTTKPVGEGTGLGLAICAGIVETHGGRLALDSEPGRGATLRVELPAESAPEAVAGERARVTAAGPRGSILLVDDEADVLEVLGDLLGAAGHRVETARDGIEALERLGAGDYDLVLSDIRMPRLDGRGLYQHAVRARPEMAGRFVMVTGDMLTGETLRFLEESGVPSVAKPFEPEAILRMVGERLAAARP